MICRKMTEKLGRIQQTANTTAATPTGALGTAVDRMSFAHDIVMMTDDAIAIGLGLGLDAQVRCRNYFLSMTWANISNNISSLFICRIQIKYSKIPCVN